MLIQSTLGNLPWRRPHNLQGQFVARLLLLLESSSENLQQLSAQSSNAHQEGFLLLSCSRHHAFPMSTPTPFFAHLPYYARLQCPVQLLSLLTAQHSSFLKSCCPRGNQRWLFGGITETWLVSLSTQGWPAQSFLLFTVQWIFHISISHHPHQYCIQVMPDPVCWDYSGFLCCL